MNYATQTERTGYNRAVMAMKKELSSLIEWYTDPSGEIDVTMLAEWYSAEHDVYTDHVGWDIPEYVFDAAIGVEKWYTEGTE